MFLALKTDQPDDATLMLIDKTGIELTRSTFAARGTLAKELLNHVDDLINQVSRQKTDISGIIVFAGPGSFTGLRIGVSTANALAYALDVPVAATKGDEWLADGLASCSRSTQFGGSTTPFYGADPHITQAKK